MITPPVSRSPTAPDRELATMPSESPAARWPVDAGERLAPVTLFEDPDQATVVFTDGACIGNPGPGGWAWAVSGDEYESGHERRTTNQRMEVTAVLQALGAITRSCARRERLHLRRELLPANDGGPDGGPGGGRTPAASRSRTRTSGARSSRRWSTDGAARSS